ncbi:MAG TPA: ATP-binding protein [Candidatus Eisenbacteria bacterium]
MTSLRARLILGAAIVAVVPLALSMYLLSRRIETAVRSDAAERLGAALGGLDAELRADAGRIEEKLQILARDPQLRRLTLVRSAGLRDLSEYLAERRFLLGLDFLQVADTTGALIADGSTAIPGFSSAGPESGRVDVATPRGPSGPRVEAIENAPGLVLAAGAPIRYENATAGIVHGGTALDVAFLARLRNAGGMELALDDGAGRLVATTLPPGAAVTARHDGVGRARIGGRSYLSRTVPIEIGAAPYAAITGFVSTEAADRTVATLRITSLSLGLIGLGVAILLGFVWSSQVSRPVERLAAFSRQLAQGDWDEPLRLEGVREIRTLGEALDRMRRDLAAYRARLIVSERQAAWSQMARNVAHEIKNPLTPIAVSISDLRRSYDLGREDFPAILDQATRTISEEIETMKRLLTEFSEFARMPAPRFAPCRLRDLFADLGALYAREVASGRLALVTPARDVTLEADAGQIRQALVNLVQNGLEAVASEGGLVTVEAGADGTDLMIRVADTGPGLSDEQKAGLFLPGFTTKTTGSGLGLTIVERIVSDHRGTIAVDSEIGRGTAIRVRLPLVRRT